MTAATRRLLAYVRCSHEDGAESGLGLAAQESSIRRWCEAHGHVVVAVLRDEAVSGGRAPHRRPAFGQAVTMLDAGEADGVVALEVSRLTRDTRHFLALRDEFRRRRWTLATVERGVLPQREQPADTFTETLLAAAAQHYRDMVTAKTRDAMAEFRGSPARCGSRNARFGFQTVAVDEDGSVLHATSDEAGNITPAAPDQVNKAQPLARHPVEYAILQELCDRRRAGEGVRVIAAALGVNPRTGKPFRPGTVASIVNTCIRWGDLPASCYASRGRSSVRVTDAA